MTSGYRLIARLAGADRLVLIHHDPRRDDEAMDRLVAEAAEYRPGTQAAREGMVLSL